MREDYHADEGLREEVLALMTRAFGYDFVAHEAAARVLGCRWEDCSTPFVARVDGAAVAHVGVLRIPLVIDGERRTVAGIHAVCADPEHRGKGHFRAVMEAAVEWASGRYETLVLGTEQPAIYERFGFRRIAEHRYLGPEAKGLTTLTTLDREDPSQLAALQALLRERVPVSQRLGVVDEVDIFGFDAAFSDVRLVGHDAALVFHVSDGICHVYDVVAREMPTLQQLQHWLPAGRIALWFSPDRYEAEWQAAPRDDGEVWMARGPFPDLPMPEMARC